MKEPGDLPSDDGPESFQELIRQIDSGQLDASQLVNLSAKQREELEQAQRALTRLKRSQSVSTTNDIHPQLAESTAHDRQSAQATPEASQPLNLSSILTLAEEWELATPRHLGRFEILRMLGRGGFGVVLLAHDPMLEQNVALKIPRSEYLLAAEGRERLMREARAATILSHPGIVPLYETGTIGLVPFISYAYCPGTSLAEWFERKDRKLDAMLAARIVARLAEAIQHAHSRGILHRDLKPANVMISEGEAASAEHLLSSLRVTDFGLARSMELSSELSQSGVPLGTPAYMSPEQARGEDSIDQATDIFSLGVILYELLTGEQPFTRTSDLATLRAIESEAPRQPGQLNSAIPKDCAAICIKCLEKNRNDRYATAQELADDLARLVNNEPVSARRIGATTRFIRWCKRNPAIAGATSFAFLSLLLGLIFSIQYGRQAHAARLLAAENERIAERKSLQAIALAGLFSKTYDSFRTILAEDIDFDDESLKDFKSRVIQNTKNHYKLVAETRPNEQAVLREYLDLIRSMAYTLQLLGDQHSSSLIWEEAAEILESDFPEDVSNWAAVNGKLAEDYRAVGRIDDAVALTNRIVERLATHATEDNARTLKEMALYLTKSAQALNSQGDHVAAKRTILQAEEIGSILTSQPSSDWPAEPMFGHIIRTKCEILFQTGEYAELLILAPIGRNIYQRLMDANDKYINMGMDSIATLHLKEGLAHSELGRHDQALANLRTALERCEQLVARNPPHGFLAFNQGNYQQNLAESLHLAGKSNEAVALATGLLTTLEQRVKQFPEMSRSFQELQIECRNLLAVVYQAQDDDVSAANHVERAIELAEELITDTQASLSLQARLGSLFLLKAQLSFSESPNLAEELANKAKLILTECVDNGVGKHFQEDLLETEDFLSRF